MAIRGQSITVCYTAWDTSANAPKTGDVANHTLRLIKDGVSAAPTNGAAEVDAANAPGQYKITLTGTEMTCDTMVLCGKSATANIVLIPMQIVTEHGYLPTNLDTNVGSRLASGPVTVGTNNDKTGYSLTVTPPTAVQVRQEMDANSTQLAGIKAKTDNLPASPAAVGSQMDLVSTPNATAITAFDTEFTNSHGSGSWQQNNVGGTGNIAVTENTGGTDNLRFVTAGGSGIANADIVAYLTSDYNAGNLGSSFIKGYTKTKTDGRFQWPLMQNSGFSYTLVYSDPNFYYTTTKTISI